MRNAILARYKAMGGKTMMAPTRTLLQVTMEAAVEADAIFTKLMGEEVEPRSERARSP